MSIFLTQAEVTELTGYAKQSKRVEWLDRRCWKFEISALGHVKVLKKYAEMKLGMPVENKQLQSTEPDFTRL